MTLSTFYSRHVMLVTLISSIFSSIIIAFIMNLAQCAHTLYIYIEPNLNWVIFVLIIEKKLA